MERFWRTSVLTRVLLNTTVTWSSDKRRVPLALARRVTQLAPPLRHIPRFHPITPPRAKSRRARAERGLELYMQRTAVQGFAHQFGLPVVCAWRHQDAYDNTDSHYIGEMGIGNTTSAAAMSAALFGGSGAEWAGRGTGVDDAGLARKSAVIDEALALHDTALSDPLEVLRRLGGRELAAMAGAIAAARAHRIPVILDGFICSAAAASLAKAQEGALDHAVAGHKSAEGAHARLLDALGKEPLLQLGLRLGEGSGAALAIGVLKGAVACHSGMATFAEAGVSEG